MPNLNGIRKFRLIIFPPPPLKLPKKTMITRTSISRWEGSGKEGSGRLSTQSPALREVPYSFDSRFGDAPGTNPEELLAAAHAGCYNMRLASLLAAENHPAPRLETQCRIHLEDGTVTRSHLMLKAFGEGISAADFSRIAEEARLTCPMSRLLKAEISLEFSIQDELEKG